uniref:Cilia- and flagella-associated protein 157 n=1 Tax=Cyprinodon variegatus TaxID=28743 RepID=A0A3Q2D6B0_CYPVA
MPRKKERKSDKNKKKLNLASPLTKASPISSLFSPSLSSRFQIKCAELEKQNKLLISQYSSLDTEKKDVTEYLKRTLSEKEDEADDLLQRLEAQRQAAVQEKQSLQLKHDKLRQELDAQINELNEKNAVLGEKLVDLEEFQRQKDELMIKLQNLEKQLECQQEKHKDEIHSLEMKDLLEKRKLEMESEVAAMSSKVQLLVEQKLPEKIRSVLQENTELKTRLSKLSEATESLLEENTSLRERRRQLSVDNDILEQTVRETSRITKGSAVTEPKSWCVSRLDRASLSAEWSSSRMERNQLEVKLKDERRRKNRMRSIMQDAANSLLQVLKVKLEK